MDAPVNICNSALSRIGERTIISLDDKSHEGAFCKMHFRSAVRYVLRLSNFACALSAPIALSSLSTIPAWKWAHEYQRPGDFISLVEIDNSPCNSPLCRPYEVAGQLLFSDVPQMKIIYVRDLSFGNGDGLNALSPDVEELIVLKLASSAAFRFAGNRSLAEALDAQFNRGVYDAKLKSSRDSNKPPIPWPHSHSQHFNHNFY
jgi:hypothetical protein